MNMYVLFTTIPLATYSDLKIDISELSSDNLKTWIERILFQLECIDIDYAIRKEEPTTLTNASTPTQVVLY